MEFIKKYIDKLLDTVVDFVIPLEDFEKKYPVDKYEDNTLPTGGVLDSYQFYKE